MHASVLTWLSQTVTRLQLGGAVTLEVGSRDEGGSPRQFFHGDYVGVDMRDGPGVDQVADAHELDRYFMEGQFEVVVCTEMIEHDDAFWLSLWQMGRLLVDGGHLLLTSRGNGFHYHPYPVDLWRFMTPDCIPVLGNLAGVEVIEWQEDPQAEHPGFMLVGRK